MTVTTFYPSSSSPMTGGGLSSAVNVALLGASASTFDGTDNAQASLYFDFSSIPSTATINTVKLETKFGWADTAPSSPIFVYGRTDAFGYMWGGGNISPSGWDEDFAGALYTYSYTAVPMTMSTLKNALRVDFGGKGRFDYVRVVVDWTPATTTPETPTTPSPKSNLTVSAARTSGSEVVAGAYATTSIVVSNVASSVSASTVHITTTANANVQTRSWHRSDNGATGTGEVDITLSTLEANAAVTIYVTDLIKSNAAGGTYACAGSVSTTTSNESGSPLSFTSASTTVLAGKQTNPNPENEFDTYIDAVWPQFVDTYTVPATSGNMNWDVNLARIRVSMDVMMSMAERNRWTFEMQVSVTRNGSPITTTAFPTVTTGTASGGRTSGGGHLEWEQLIAVAPEEVIVTTVRCRMHGYYMTPSSTENHVYCSPCRVEIEPRN